MQSEMVQVRGHPLAQTEYGFGGLHEALRGLQTAPLSSVTARPADPSHYPFLGIERTLYTPHCVQRAVLDDAAGLIAGHVVKRRKAKLTCRRSHIVRFTVLSRFVLPIVIVVVVLIGVAGVSQRYPTAAQADEEAQSPPHGGFASQSSLASSLNPGTYPPQVHTAGYLDTEAEQGYVFHKLHQYHIEECQVASLRKQPFQV